MELELIQQFIETTEKDLGDSGGHVLSMFALAHATRGKRYLELGVQDGMTTLPILLAAHRNGGHLTSVDIKHTDFKCPADLANSWEFVQEDSLKFLRDVEGIYDFVFIDDFHTYPHVKKELEFLESHLTTKSIVLLHDLMYYGTQPKYHSRPALTNTEWAYGGPYRAVKELDQKKWEWATLPWTNGLTILRKKDSIVDGNPMRMRLKGLLRKISPKLERYLVSVANHGLRKSTKTNL